MPTENDFEIKAFRKILKKLDEHQPITEAYDGEHGQENDVWWSTQKEHMLGWHKAQLTHGGGSYTRKKINNSAKKTYNRLLNVGAILWIAEALGAPKEAVQKAADAALAEPEYRSKPAKARKHIPWEMICDLAKQKQPPSIFARRQKPSQISTESPEN